MDDAGSTMSQGPATPASNTAAGDPPGMRAQLGATFEAAKRLLRAHVDLGKAELGEIVDNVKKLVGLGLVALALLFLAAMLLLFGGLLFLGEWLFGSIGWGVLLGTLLLIDLALVALLAALDVSLRRIGISFLLGAAIGVGIGLVLGFDVLHQGWRALGDAVAQPVFADEPTRTVMTAVIGLALVAGILGFIGGVRSGIGAGIMGFIAAGVLGAIIGWITATPVSAQVGAALGVLVALIAWPIFAGLDVMRTGIDGEEMARKFTPDETINLTKETIEWVRARTPLVPKS